MDAQGARIEEILAASVAVLDAELAVFQIVEPNRVRSRSLKIGRALRRHALPLISPGADDKRRVRSTQLDILHTYRMMRFAGELASFHPPIGFVLASNWLRFPVIFGGTQPKIGFVLAKIFVPSDLHAPLSAQTLLGRYHN